MLSLTILKTILKENKIISDDDLKNLQKQASEQNLSVEELIIEKKLTTEEELYKLAAKHFKVPFINLKDMVISQNVITSIPQPIAQTHKIIAFERTPEKLKVATQNPKDLETIEFIARQTNLQIEVYLASPKAINESLKLYRQDIARQIEEARPLQTTELPVVKVVDSLFENAILEGASDIHIEPTEKEMIVRYRVDGVLRAIMTLPKTMEPGVVSRIKVLAGLKIDEHRLPQDGRFKIKKENYEVTFRTSIVPTINGEKVAMRLLNEKAEALSLEQLGFQSEVLEIVRANVKKPKGMILVTGPTGSGKTTTLYSIINVLNRPEVNILTIEDPIEYTIPGINQSQINPKIGFTFASGLRSFLRQDPDIIMVGEIRDAETAEIAVHAALTGHLVLSTLHTNDAVTTLPRLLEMGIPPYLISSTTNLVMAQRLVRKICQHCIESYHLSKAAVENIAQNFNIKNLIDFLVKKRVLTSSKPSLEDILFYRGKGCKICGQDGYKGRTGIYEALEIEKSVSDLILRKASSQDLQSAAVATGMMTMMQDGFLKAIKGVTTVEEVVRVTQEY